MRKLLGAGFAAVLCSLVIAGCSTSTGGRPTSLPPASAGSSTSATAASSAATQGGNETIAPGELEARVTAAMKAADSFHLIGSGVDSGAKLQFDLHFSGHKTAGLIVQGGQQIELINPGGQSVYFRLPAAMWKQLAGDAAATMFAGKWVKVPAADKDFQQLSQAFDRDSFITGILSGASGELTKVGSATVGGVAATEYRASDGSPVFIAASGPPVVLKAVDTSSDGGTLTISDYGKPYAVTAPPASQTVDFSAMGH